MHNHKTILKERVTTVTRFSNQVLETSGILSIFDPNLLFNSNIVKQKNEQSPAI